MDSKNLLIPCIDKGGYRQFGWYDIKAAIKDRLFHLGSDRNCEAGTEVYSLLSGKVIYSDEVQGFGPNNRKGGVIIVESVFNNETFSILYGHIIRDKKLGDLVEVNEPIGNIIRYYTAEFRADHLHWGVWKGGGIPKGHWGYEKEIDPRWINPNVFLNMILK